MIRARQKQALAIVWVARRRVARHACASARDVASVPASAATTAAWALHAHLDARPAREIPRVFGAQACRRAQVACAKHAHLDHSRARAERAGRRPRDIRRERAAARSGRVLMDGDLDEGHG